MAAAWLGPDKGSKPAVVLAGGILGQTLVQRDVAFTSPDRPETALRIVSHIGRGSSSTAQTVVAMAGPGNFEPKSCSANMQASKPRRNRAASVPAVGTPWPLGFAPFLPPGVEARYRWYRRNCPTSRSEDVLGGCQSVDGLPAERPDPHRAWHDPH